MNSFYRFWFLSLGFKFLISALLPYSSDESYYWVWSQHLQLSYFDHPPMVAWLFKLGNSLEPIAGRWPILFVGHLSWIVWHRILNNKINSTAWAILLLLNPLLGWGTFLAIPDTPAVFFWSLSLFAWIRWVENRDIKWAFILGAALGLGFTSKYHMVLFVPCAFIWLTWTKKWSAIQWTHVPLIVVSGLLFSSPVLVWNYLNDFDSFKFQLGHGLAAEKSQWIWPLEYLGAQIGLLFPTVFLLAMTWPRDSFRKLLYVFGWFPILFFLLTSLKARPEGNWPILGYPALICLAAMKDSFQKYFKATVIVWIIAFSVALSESFWGWLPIQDKSNLKTFEFYRFDEFIPWLDSDIPVYASSFQMAATLHYKTQRPIYKLRTLSRKDFYDYLPGSLPPDSGQFMILANRETDFGNTILKNYKFIEEKHFTPHKKIMIYEAP